MTKSIPYTSKELWELLDYDPATGALTWKPRGVDTREGRSWDARYAGKEAGWKVTEAKARGGAPHQIRVGIENKYYGAHRLIWKMMAGEEPPRIIDHKNGDPWDNRWGNLADGDDGRNHKNRKPTSMDRPPGVRFHKARGCWEAYGSEQGEHIILGYYEPEDYDLACMEAMEYRAERGYSKRHWSPWQGGN